MSENQNLSAVYRCSGSRYSGHKEVSRMVDRPRADALLLGRLGGMVVAVLLVLLVGLPIVSYAQEEPFFQRVSGAVIFLPDGHLPALMELAGVLEMDEQARSELIESPREFLANQAFVQPIELASDEFQITVLDFSVPAEELEEPWFGVTEPQDELGFDRKGVGIFYGAIGIFIQEAIEIVDPEAETIIEQQKEDMFRFISDRLAADTGDRLREVLRELDGMDLMDPRRLAYLDNARQYLLDHERELTLPASRYRIVALDFDRAAATGTVTTAEIRPGLAVIPEGIGVFNHGIGIFLQQVI